MFLFLCGLFGLSWYLTGQIRQSTILDIPNERSSHCIPTAKGGGLAFVICFLLAIGGMTYIYPLPMALIQALFIVGISTASIGFCDDRLNIAAGYRLLMQIALVLCTTWVLNLPGTLWSLFSIACLLSLINIFNFLDGIDGYAAMEAGFVATVMATISTLDGLTGMGFILTGFAASVWGFSLWNIPPAKIFMGDVGSGFLGGILGVCALYMGYYHLHYLWVWGILMGGFLMDASVTLGIRAYRREKIWQSHCQHAYQHAAKALQSHGKVTGGLLLINTLWLLPWAYIAWQDLCSPWVSISLAYAPLLGLALYWRAGRSPQEGSSLCAH